MMLKHSPSLYVILLMLLIFSLSYFQLGLGEAHAIKAGDVAPNFTLRDAISGKTISLTDYRGKIILLDFFSTWCGYSTRAIKEVLVPLWKEHYVNNPNVIFLSINIWDHKATGEHLREFAKYYSIEWPILMGTGTDVDDKYGIEGVPTVIIIDGINMEIKYRHEGLTNIGYETLKSEIDSLIRMHYITVTLSKTVTLTTTVIRTVIQPIIFTMTINKTITTTKTVESIRTLTHVQVSSITTYVTLTEKSGESSTAQLLVIITLAIIVAFTAVIISMSRRLHSWKSYTSSGSSTFNYNNDMTGSSSEIMVALYPKAGYYLSLIGGIVGLFVSVFSFIKIFALSFRYLGYLDPIIFFLLWFIIAQIIIIYYARKIKSYDLNEIKRASKIVIIFSIIGGLNIISLVGGILGLTWKLQK